MAAQKRKPIEPPQQVILSREERLELENIQLKMTMAQQEVQRHLNARGQWSERINKKYGVNLAQYTILVDEGVCNRINVIDGGKGKDTA